MDRFQEMQVFIRIAERRSFSAAAEDLAIPRATVSNLVQRLEQRLGTRLLERTTRQVRLTLDGEAYVQRCIRLLADLEEADSAFRDARPQGLLRVNLQGTLARHFVLPELGSFLAMYPDLRLQIGDDDRLVDLVKEGVDCVLRAGTPQDSSLIARPIARLEQLTVASRAYLATHGAPHTLAELAQHFAVDYIARPTGRALSLEFSRGKEVLEIALQTRVAVTGADLYASAALAGLGMVQVPRYRIEAEIASGELQILLPDHPPPPLQISVLYPHSRQLSPRVRVFTQWLAERFAGAR